MKKILSILIIGVMLFGTSAVAFATEGEQTSIKNGNAFGFEKMNQVRTETRYGMEDKTTPAGIKIRLTEEERLELQTMKAEIKANHVVLVELKKSILGDLQTLKNAAKPEDDEFLDAEQITNMKSILADLKLARQDINVNLHPGMLKQQAKEARMQKNFVSMRDALNNILAEQEKRIDALTDIEAALNSMIEDLDL